MDEATGMLVWATFGISLMAAFRLGVGGKLSSVKLKDITKSSESEGRFMRVEVETRGQELPTQPDSKPRIMFGGIVGLKKENYCSGSHCKPDGQKDNGLDTVTGSCGTKFLV
ncbi:hypothetical protein DFH07DRAFT_768940 [Mycena maculata]|uniref:Uncharacterized protein n=1 Tax=Mycena maculata TaxID=230809 RepID=A0AAD7NQ34_9AGAR|nr:hypothetical protein DFH07DRAFT_768940 [Mycena maculata]